jgi:preprotein translocase subunit SecG
MVAAGYVMKHAGQSGGLGNVFGGGAGSGAREADAHNEASGSADILGQIMGAAGKFLGR